MESKILVSTNITQLNIQPSEWKCELFGCSDCGITLRPEKGQEPNWFWRWMQYLAFGNRWIKNNEIK